MSREIKIFGVGFSETGNKANIEIKIDDNVIHSGEIDAINQESVGTYFGNKEEEREIASWTEDDAASTKKLSIKVSEGFFAYKQTLTTFIGQESKDNPELMAVHMYEEDDGDTISDPNTNVLLDGDPYPLVLPEDNRDENFGQWDILIREGETMVCDLIIDEGQVDPGTTETDSGTDSTE